MNPPRQSVLILIVADLSPRSSRYSQTGEIECEPLREQFDTFLRIRPGMDMADGQPTSVTGQQSAQIVDPGPSPRFEQQGYPRGCAFHISFPPLSSRLWAVSRRA